ncbi:hypothetical protein [Mesorhizobium sp.]|nr:hypothetical protein [Mesorhizobium sp.]
MEIDPGNVTAEQSRSLADEYLQHVRQQAPGALRIVDKLPYNFELIDLI